MADLSTAAYRPEPPVSFSPIRDSGWAYLIPEKKSLDDDTTYSEVFTVVEKYIAQRKKQSRALADVVAQEANLIKKSVIVTLAGAIGATGLVIFIWALCNAFLGVALDRAGFHLALNAFILLSLNGLFLAFCIKAIQTCYRHITIMPIIQTITRSPSDDEEQQN